MGSAEDPEVPDDPELAELRAIVPARAVLTELARGFLLVHESNPGRALRFAETFVRECSAGDRGDRVETTRAVSEGRRRLGRGPHGAIDPSHPPPPR
jgi:hypothetical protein